MRVLVIDDGVDQVEALGELLTVLGHEVRTALDGESGIQAALAFVPDVALVDIGLPGISGYEVARRFRAEPALRHTRLVAQTGWGEPEDVALARAAGFDLHFIKPLDLDQLKAAVTQS